MNFSIRTPVSGLVLGLMLVSSPVLLHCQHEKRMEAAEAAPPDSVVEEDFVTSTIEHPLWSYNTTIYEANIRHFSPEGNFKGFAKELKRLKELGVSVIWLMPIHPIGEKNRQGTMGNPYSVANHVAVNPDYGTLQEFKALVQKIHDHGMYVIIDWVANHTAWDHPLTQEHKEWYNLDSTGNFMPPFEDWTDVIDLNYDQPELHAYMQDAMEFWVRETNIDGFRCDLAGLVPLEFWEETTAELRKIKPLLMLAEWEAPEFHARAFDMTYGRNFFGIVNAVAQGYADSRSFDNFLYEEANSFPHNAFRLYFTTNHDENAWNQTARERLGDGLPMFTVLSATLRGVPLIFNGQEADLNRNLKLYEKDHIRWRKGEMYPIIEKLLKLRKENTALWNGERGGEVTKIHNSGGSAVFSFVRERDDDKVFVVVNLSPEKQIAYFNEAAYRGTYQELFSEEAVVMRKSSSVELAPWDYRVYVKTPPVEPIAETK